MPIARHASMQTMPQQHNTCLIPQENGQHGRHDQLREAQRRSIETKVLIGAAVVRTIQQAAQPAASTATSADTALMACNCEQQTGGRTLCCCNSISGGHQLVVPRSQRSSGDYTACVGKMVLLSNESSQLCRGLLTRMQS